MKHIGKIAAFVLTITVAFAFVPFFGTADAASKKKVTVVKSMKITFDSNVTYKDLKKNTIKYNKAGLITKYKDTEGAYTLKYKNNKLSTLTAKMKDPTDNYKNYYYGLEKLEKKCADGTLITFDLTASGKKIVKVVENYPGGGSTATYSYNKKGHIKKSKIAFNDGAAPLKTTHKFDKKGNVVQSDVKNGTEDNSRTFAHIIYGKNKLPKEIQATFISYTAKTAYTAVYKFKYKNIKVPAKNVKVVKEQQWKLLNAPSDNDIPRGESLVW